MLTSCLYANYIRKSLNQEERYGKGSWAVVTGATGGIGEAFCKQLAQKNFNIVLIGRSKEKLEESEKNIKSVNSNTKTLIVQADLDETLDPKFYENIHSQVKNLDISILVNNAGHGRAYPFELIGAEEAIGNIRLNAGSPAMLTHSLINGMLKREKRSAIINVSSIGQNSPLPYLGVYPATKRFLSFFSYSLHDNFKHKIDVQDLTPGYVSTKIANFKKGSDTITADKCVKCSLRDLGQSINCIPVVAHSIMALTMRSTHNFLFPFWRENVAGAAEKMALRSFMTENEEKKKQKKDD